ncbi:MAG: hypothetical protein K2N03_00225 [Muribaculaceae bacterium]|nr:hypothetical protein [Muribaculaceae bacterium]
MKIKKVKQRVCCLSLLAGMIVFMGLGGCASSECIGNQNAIPYAGFYRTGDEEKVNISGLSVVGEDAPGDSLLTANGGNSGNVVLPFRVDADETSFIFTFRRGTSADGTADEWSEKVTFKYERQLWFVSAACGAMYNFKVTDISHTRGMIDSIACPGGLITNENRENIKIFFNDSYSKAAKGGIAE